MSASAEPERIDWLVFAEDWAGHASTTQHLVAHLPQADRVLWVDSLGMRSPRLDRADLSRILGRLRGLARDRSARHPAEASSARRGRAPDEVLRPLLLPWHERAPAVALNRLLLGQLLRRAARRVDLSRPTLVTANPAVVRYLDRIETNGVVYMRLDDFASLPGVDASLVHATEPDMMACADLVIAPSARLVPPGIAPERARVLPQGVDVAAFSAVPLGPPSGPLILGYWGAIGEWLDFDLICQVARALPDCRIELRGEARADERVRVGLRKLARFPNVALLPAVPHHELGQVAAHWGAAWAPFLPRSVHLEHASPLKLREYLAAGFPSASTPIREATELDGLCVVDGLDGVLAWIAREVRSDSRDARTSRRARMLGEGWDTRARTLREWVADVRCRRARPA